MSPRLARDKRVAIVTGAEQGIGAGLAAAYRGAVNAEDRTPIVAEIKVGADENAELGLIQALAAAAQLSSASQLTRLHRQFKDFFSNEAPSAVDVYVITPPRR